MISMAFYHRTTSNKAHNLLEGATPKVISVAGFPMGYSMIPTKVEEVKRILDDGADEVDVVINISAVKNGNWAHVKNEINSVTFDCAHEGASNKDYFRDWTSDE